MTKHEFDEVLRMACKVEYVSRGTFKKKLMWMPGFAVSCSIGKRGGKYINIVSCPAISVCAKKSDKEIQTSIQRRLVDVRFLEPGEIMQYHVYKVKTL